ncbi:MAG: DUF2490 domain-containing protein [Fulvivirga sp.]|uniref:DUF2490 domain-containing protein n=1 Tax=Fulvivirga sp. TaxID=1931237 RepID=UPI0032EF9A0E
MKLRLKILVFSLTGLFLAVSEASYSQERPKESVYKEPITATWINTYGNIRISNHLFWIAQTHLRLEESESTPFAGQVAQIYNRHAINYLFSKYFNVSLGGVLRINYNTSKQEMQKNTVPEWRIWHEYQFAQPFHSLMVYHRIRVEHRWTKGFNPDSEFIFRNRWRYMFKLKMPIGKPKLGSNTFYVSPEAELIMQSGGPVVDSPMEDLRLHASIGYIVNPRLSVATGIMHSHGQEISDGSIYKQKWTMRFHVYFSPDLRKVKHKLPSIHTGD